MTLFIAFCLLYHMDAPLWLWPTAVVVWLFHLEKGE